IPYHGDLGLDNGKAQSVYSLDKTHLKTYKSKDPKKLGPVARIKLAEGQTVKLADGSSIRFDGVRRWVKLQISNSPGKGLALGGVLLGIVGLMGSLFIRPRRAWVRVTRRGGRTVVEVAGLDRSSGGDLGDEIDTLARAVSGRADDDSTSEETT
ncbi:MAG: cytochrome c biogenesis protein ResB, partial [Nocardioides sp.]